VIGRCQVLAQQGPVVQSAADTEVAGVVGAGFGAQDAVAASIIADVVLGE
jgi:hypothetical protein